MLKLFIHLGAICQSHDKVLVKVQVEIQIDKGKL